MNNRLIYLITIASFFFVLTSIGCGAEKEREQGSFSLYDYGTERIINYERYGEFFGIGTKDYSYRVKDRKTLSKAVGEGIYPNASVYKDPEYKKLQKDQKLKGSHWNFVNIDDYKISFYKWATAEEDPGVKQFYTAQALENAGLLNHAIKAYQAVLIHYPRAISWTYWRTPWYVGQVAIDKIRYITRKHPNLNMKLVDAHIRIKNGYDNDVANDVFDITPGRIVRCKANEVIDKRVDLNKLRKIKQVGYGSVHLIQYENRHWQLMVDRKPYIIKAVAYQPTKIGQSPDEGTMEDWMKADYNNNGKIDAPYEAWTDANSKKPIGDFELMKEMGANTIRLYHHASNRELLRDLYNRYGIRVLMGDLLGAYAVGSGASWYRGTDYRDPIQRQNMMDSVKQMVIEHKDEPYILMWVLGNETNYGVANNSKKYPDVYYAFVNDIAKMIKSLDPDHPVAICNGDTLFLDIFAKNCPDIDVYGSNSYRGRHGFGLSMWSSVKDECDKPVIITEYGCPAYRQGETLLEAEESQAEYHEGAWQDIHSNTAGMGLGNAIGGVVYEWVDEWWKAYEPALHDTHPLWTGPFPGGYMYEEWLGITSQGDDGKNSPYERHLRKAYFSYKKVWRE